ncbi:hypothetical protein HK098_003268 [Nowakowskiella sp. JEL0407]|nr:hypothetical protein HK098_003268 [Nowakowskiella sp. JEL0407]
MTSGTNMSVQFVVEVEAEEKEKRNEKEKFENEKPSTVSANFVSASTIDLDSLTCPLCYNFPKKTAKLMPCCNRVICSDCLRDFFQGNSSQYLPPANELEKVVKKLNKKPTPTPQPSTSSDKPNENLNADTDTRKDSIRESEEEEEEIGPQCPFCRKQLLFIPGLVRIGSETIKPASIPSNSNDTLDALNEPGSSQKDRPTSPDDDIPLVILARNLKRTQRITLNLPDAEIQKTLNGLDVYCPYNESAGCTWIGRRDALFAHLTKECIVCVDQTTKELSIPIAELKKYELDNDEISLREKRPSPVLHSFFVPPLFFRAFEGGLFENDRRANTTTPSGDLESQVERRIIYPTQARRNIIWTSLIIVLIIVVFIIMTLLKY